MLALLGRAQTVPDIIAVQNQLGQITQQIEQLKGQISYIEHNTTLHRPQWVAGIPVLYTHLIPATFGGRARMNVANALGAAAALAPQSAKENGPVGGKPGRLTLMRQFGGRLGDLASSQRWLATP